MSWTDLESMRHIKEISRQLSITDFVETGTHVGINAFYHSANFKRVNTCEKDFDLYEQAKERLKDKKNVFLYLSDSATFLKHDVPENAFVYLDAHFYDPKLKQKWVVLDELKSLEGRTDISLAIHDFDNNLGHLNYDGETLNFELIKDRLLKVNPNSHFYTNHLDSCNIKKLEDAADEDERSNLEYAWSKPDKTFRGILYATPREVDVNGLRPFG